MPVKPNRTRAWAALAAGEEVTPINITLAPMKPFDIELQVTHCGISSSDIDLIDKRLGEASVFPQVCGHEIVGWVTACGDAVTNVRPGIRVGVGWQSGACFTCKHSRGGAEQFCKNFQATCAFGNQGGFSERFRCDSRFAFKIPDTIKSEAAAPLLCAGHTVFTAMLETRPGDGVGVLGLGGLGHLAVQFAAKRGCHVTVLSLSRRKETEAKLLGAKRFIVEADEYDEAAGTLDYVLVTSTGAFDWLRVCKLLAPGGTICFVGSVEPFEFNPRTMMSKSQRVLTSNTGGCKDMEAMLEFAAAHNVRPMVETLPISELNAGIAKVRRNDVRYRMVVELTPGQKSSRRSRL